MGSSFVQRGDGTVVGVLFGKPTQQQKSCNGPLPPTRYPGSRTIDGIFVSPGIQVRACGILGATDKPTMTDHAALWMDFSPTQLYGTKPPLFIRPDARRLQLNRPSVVSKFQSTVFKVASSQKIHTRINQYHRHLPHLDPTQRITAWQDIWNDTNYAVQLGERKCRKLRMGAHGFSDEWAQII